MSNLEEIRLKNGYYISELTKTNDADVTTPTEFKYTIMLLCVEGEAVIDANMRELHLVKGDCLCVANILYKHTIKMSDNFKARVLLCNSSFAFGFLAGVPASFFESIYANPIINLSDEKDWALINKYYDSLSLMQDHNFGTRHVELVALSMRSIVLLMSVFRCSGVVNEPYYSHSDVYFRQFIELIDKHVMQEHEVEFYASELRITAKYLSKVCKNKVGHKAKEIITSFLIAKIKHEMVMTEKSIKTIAYDYGFSDQASMGKFFTKFTGMSPMKFRKGYKGLKSIEEKSL